MPRPGFSIGDLLYPKKRQYQPDYDQRRRSDDSLIVAARQAAEKIRTDLGIHPPVALDTVCEYLAVAVQEVDRIEEHPNACGVYRGDGHIEIVRSLERRVKRITLAHELGHEVLKHSFRDKWDIQDNLFASTNPLEHQAWEFARELLIPYRVLKENRARPPEELELLFDVTAAAIAVQLSARHLL